MTSIPVTTSDILDIWAPLATLQISQEYVLSGVTICRLPDEEEFVKSFEYSDDGSDGSDHVITLLEEAGKRLEWKIRRK